MCLTQTDGKAWPFRPGVYSGPAEAEYDSDPARFLRMMFFTGRASSCRALQPWSKPTLKDPRRTAGQWFGRLPDYRKRPGSRRGARRMNLGITSRITSMRGFGAA